MKCGNWRVTELRRTGATCAGGAQARSPGLTPGHWKYLFFLYWQHHSQIPMTTLRSRIATARVKPWNPETESTGRSEIRRKNSIGLRKDEDLPLTLAGAKKLAHP